MIKTLLRAFPSFKGKQRLARLLLKNTIANGKDLIVKDKYGCVFTVPNIKENIGFELFINGVYEDETICFLNSKIPANGELLDIGANIGAITFPICKQRPDARALCIEASPRVYSYLQKNKLASNVNNAIIVNKAISLTDGDKVSFFSPVEQFGKGSLSNVFTNDAEAIETITLDSLVRDNGFNKIAVIKVDIEGFEHNAFKSGPTLLGSPDAPDILFEFVDWAEKRADLKPGDAQRVLIGYGYKLALFSSDGTLTPLDVPLTKGTAMIFATKKSGS